MNTSCKKMFLPEKCKVLTIEEMINVEGGITAEAIVGMIIAIGTAEYGAAYAVGKRAAHSISKKEYNKVKWPVRVGVVAFFGPVSGGIVMTGFENVFYDNK